MQKLIQPSIHKSLTERPPRRLDDWLWISDLGRNPYSAARRLLLRELEDFDIVTLLKMQAGKALERQTEEDMKGYMDRPYLTQFPIWNSMWAGYADFVFNHSTPDVIIYDHKGSAGKWWDYNASLPRVPDCCQVWQYGQIYYEQYGIQPRLGLYYRGWGPWAEFEIERVETEAGFHLQARGFITDEKGEVEHEVIRVRDVDPVLLCDELEDLYTRIKAGRFSIDDLEAMRPNGPDWNYAEAATRRLR